MDSKKKQEWIQSVIVGIVVLLTRLPFISAGYGAEPDCWRVVNAAKLIATQQTYVPSRLPGFPVEEFTCSLVWMAGPTVLNGISALLSAIAAVFFLLIQRSYRIRDAVIGTLVLAMTPVIFINSTGLKDYVWALTFILGSYHFVLCGRPIVAGVLLGVAAGCRLTSFGMVIPLSYILFWDHRDLNRWRPVIRFVTVATVIALALYLPVMFNYGWPIPRFQGELRYLPRRLIIDKIADALGGRTGLMAFSVGVAHFIVQWVRRRKFGSIALLINKHHVRGWVMALVMYSALFFALPHQAGYLIPLLPFVLLLGAKYLNRPALLTFSVIMLLSPFLSFGRTGVYGGPIFQDHTRRLESLKYVESIIDKSALLGENSIVVAGWWLPQIEASVVEGQQKAKYVYLIDRDQLEQARRIGKEIYYLPDIDEYNLRATGVDLSHERATPLAVTAH